MFSVTGGLIHVLLTCMTEFAKHAKIINLNFNHWDWSLISWDWLGQFFFQIWCAKSSTWWSSLQQIWFHLDERLQSYVHTYVVFFLSICWQYVCCGSFLGHTTCYRVSWYSNVWSFVYMLIITHSFRSSGVSTPTIKLQLLMSLTNGHYHWSSLVKTTSPLLWWNNPQVSVTVF